MVWTTWQLGDNSFGRSLEQLTWNWPKVAFITASFTALANFAILPAALPAFASRHTCATFLLSKREGHFDGPCEILFLIHDYTYTAWCSRRSQLHSQEQRIGGWISGGRALYHVTALTRNHNLRHIVSSSKQSQNLDQGLSMGQIEGLAVVVARREYVSVGKRITASPPVYCDSRT